MWVVTQCEKTAGDHLNNDYVELETFFFMQTKRIITLIWAHFTAVVSRAKRKLILHE